MSMFKDFEKDWKTKNFSTLKLMSSTGEEGEDELSEVMQEVVAKIDEIIERIKTNVDDTIDFKLESLKAKVASAKKPSSSDQAAIKQQEKFKSWHEFHLAKLEGVKRACL